jgi:hypothetical protein
MIEKRKEKSAMVQVSEIEFESNENTACVLDYENDPRFVAYMKSRLDMAIKDREAGKLVDSEIVFAGIRRQYGW